MVEVRDWVNGQGWFDVSQYRMNVPSGVPMHWSRLVDLPIAFFIEILRPWMGEAKAEIFAAAIVPMLTLLLLIMVLARLVDSLFGRREALIACVMTLLAGTVVPQFQFYRVDHHAWQAVCAGLMMVGAFSADSRRGGWLLGASAATWLVISMEGLPMVVGTIMALGLGWVFQREGDRDGLRMESATWALALTAGALWMATRLPQGFEVWCDSLSAFHLATFAAAALGTSLTRKIATGPLACFLGLAATACVCAVILAAPAPQCVTGAFNDLPPLVHRYWYEHVAEGLPIWDQSAQVVEKMLALLPVGILGLVLLWRTYPEHRGNCAMYMALMGLAVGISMLVERASCVATIVTIPPASFAVNSLLIRARKIASPPARIIATVATLSLVAPAIFFNWSSLVKKSTAEQDNILSQREEACLLPRRLEQIGAVIDGLHSGRNVLAPLDIGPALLFSTDVTVVASSHHRNKIAMNDVIRFWMGRPQEAYKIVQAYRSDYVLYCPGISEPQLYSKAAPDGMMAQLSAGNVPAWLKPLHDPRLGAMKVYQVVHEEGRGSS